MKFSSSIYFCIRLLITDVISLYIVGRQVIVVVVIITTTTTTTTTTLFDVDLKRRDCPSAANTISRDVGIFNGGSDLNNDLLDVDIFTKQIRTLNTTYAVDW